MRKVLIVFLILIGLPSFSKVITGEISKDLKTGVNQVVDAENNVPIEGVIIKIPSKNYQTKLLIFFLIKK